MRPLAAETVAPIGDERTFFQHEPPPGSDADVAQKDAIVGALALYLDFVNLFLYLLRIFGRARK